MMFSSQGKCTKAIHGISAAINNEEIGGEEQHLSHKYNKHQNKIDAQAAEIAVMKSELNKALQKIQI